MERIDALDAALDRLVVGRPADATGELAPLLETAAELRTALAVAVPAEVAERHLARIGEPGAAVAPFRPKRRARRALAATLAAAIVLSMGAGSAFAASRGAVPGDALYGVKRAGEGISLALHRDHSSRARLHLEFAQRRLDELQTLLERRRNGEDVAVGAAMRAYHSQLAAGEADASAAALGTDYDDLLAHIQAQLEKHVQKLTELLGTKTNPHAREALQRAIDNAQKAKDRVLHGRATKGEDPGHGKPSGVGRESAPGQTR